MKAQAEPVSRSERIYTLDVIRGTALLGIFIMNLPTFAMSGWAGLDGTEPFPQWWNLAAGTARDVLFSGKFNSMFSMLFAIGFTIQLERLETRDPAHATAIYLRRIGWLFVFGITHALVLWTGDVLHMYALMGVTLLLLRRVSDRVVWTLFALLFLYPIGLGLYRLLTTTPETIQHLLANAKAWETSDNAAYGAGGTYLAAVKQNARQMWFYYTNQRQIFSMLAVYAQLGCTMLIGLLLGRHDFFRKSEAYLPAVRRVQWLALAVGIAAGAVYGTWLATTTQPMVPSPFRLLANFCYYVCRIATMAFYVTTLIRGVHSTAWRQRLAPLATAGRMPLTNYLMQSVIGALIFYCWGLGYWLQIGPALCLVLPVIISFGIQVPLSYLWLRHFELGPMEYLWRVLTYGRMTLRARTSPIHGADGPADAVPR